MCHSQFEPFIPNDVFEHRGIFNPPNLPGLFSWHSAPEFGQVWLIIPPIFLLWRPKPAIAVCWRGRPGWARLRLPKTKFFIHSVVSNSILHLTQHVFVSIVEIFLPWPRSSFLLSGFLEARVQRADFSVLFGVFLQSFFPECTTWFRANECSVKFCLLQESCTSALETARWAAIQTATLILICSQICTGPNEGILLPTA